MTNPFKTPIVGGYRVLLVDDYEPWRSHIRATLQKVPRWQIVGEVGDGLEAVNAARAAEPDLILLDVGLPTLSGVQAARRIMAHNVRARILFVSEHFAWDVAEAALGTGARGYIVKSDAGRELLPAMDAIVDGGRFVSARLGGRALQETAGYEPPRHEVAVHSDDASLVDDFVRFIEAVLTAGDSVIGLVAASRRERVRQGLQACGLDVDRAIREGRCNLMDAAAALSDFMIEGWPDDDRFWKAAHSLVLRAAKAARGDRPRVAACGECAPHVARAGAPDAAIRIEQLWNELGRVYELNILCAYIEDGVELAAGSDFYRQMCREHMVVYQRRA